MNQMGEDTMMVFGDQTAMETGTMGHGLATNLDRTVVTTTDVPAHCSQEEEKTRQNENTIVIQDDASQDSSRPSPMKQGQIIQEDDTHAYGSHEN